MSFILKFTQAGVATFYATIVPPSLFSPDLDELENWPRREMGGGDSSPSVHAVAPPLRYREKTKLKTKQSSVKHKKPKIIKI